MMMAAEKKIAAVDLGRGVGDRRELAAQAAAACAACRSPDWRASSRPRQMAEDVLDHDHGGIDDQAEVDGAHRQQVRRLRRAAPGSRRRTAARTGWSPRRSARCADCRGTATAQEDQHDAHHHVVQHGVGGDVDQIAAVVDPLDLHAGRQDVGVVDACSTSASTRLMVGMLSAPRRISTMPCDDVVVVVLAGDAEPRLVADRRRWRRRATSTGEPLLAVSMVCAISSIERIWPTPRTTADCGPKFTVWPPTLMLPLFSACEHLRQRQAVGQSAGRDRR